MRIGHAGPPPIAIGIIFLPEHPDFARTICQQVFARETHSNSKTFRALAHQHDVAGVFHHGLRNHRHIFDVAHATDRASTARGAVHAASIEFDYTFFVGQAAETNGIVVGIVLRALHDANTGVESIATAFQERVGRFDVIAPVVRADDDRALGGISLRSVALRDRFGESVVRDGMRIRFPLRRLPAWMSLRSHGAKKSHFLLVVHTDRGRGEEHRQRRTRIHAEGGRISRGTSNVHAFEKELATLEGQPRAVSPH